MLTILSACLAVGSCLIPVGEKGLPLKDSEFGSGWGVNIHFTQEQPGELAKIAQAGFKFIRMDFVWSEIEKEKGEYNFNDYDRLVFDCAKNGIRCLFILDYGNSLYQTGAPSNDETRVAFCSFVRAAVTHFKGKGIVWEMWNEPNIHFWQPYPNVNDYIKLALAVGRTIRATAPKEIYIGPAVASFDWPFLEECFKAGLLNYFDGVSLHGYRQSNPETTLTEWAKLRNLIDRYSKPGHKVQMVSGEWGYSELYNGLNLDLQSKYITRQYLTNLMSGVNLSIWYDWKDDGLNPTEPEHHFGTVYANLAPKLTYANVLKLSGLLAGYRYHGSISIPDNDNVKMMVFKHEGWPTKVAIWSPDSDTTIDPSLGYCGTNLKLDGDNTVGLLDALSVQPVDGNVQVITINNRLAQHLLARPALPSSSSVGSAKDLAAILRPLVGKMKATEKMQVWDLPIDDSPKECQANTTVTASDGSQLEELIKGFPRLKDRTHVLRKLVVSISDSDKTFTAMSPLRTKETKVKSLPGSAEALRKLNLKLGSKPEAPVRFEPNAIPRFNQTCLMSHREPIALQVSLSGDRTIRVTVIYSLLKDTSVIVKLETNLQSQTKPANLKADNVIQDIDFAVKDGTSTSYIRCQISDSNGKQMAVLPEIKMLEIDLTGGAAIGDKPDPNRFASRVEGDEKVSGKLETLVVKTEGTNLLFAKAVELSYEFGQGWKYGYLGFDSNRTSMLPGKPVSLSLWINGDSSRNTLRIRYEDETGQTHQIDGPKVEWTGWRLVNFDLTRIGISWGGAKDSKVHFPIRLQALPLIDRTGDLKGSIKAAGATVFYR